MDAVLDAAEKLFSTAGPANVSLRAIAEEAGVNYGLVHRHFGTKSTLFDQLMQRTEDRWLSQMRTNPEYEAALEQILGVGPDSGANVRLLAWTLLSDREEEAARSYRNHTTLDQLPGMLEPRGVGEELATLDTAAALAFALGWQFFKAYIRAALHLDGHPTISAAELETAMRERLHRIATPLPGPASP